MENQFSQEYFHRVQNMNQNDINDDDPPCPPPGLDRLVTGQTVSFDDGSNTPTFDRIVTGERMSSRASARIPTSMYNKSFFNDTSPQDFFDSYLHNANVHEDSKTANQPPGNKYPNHNMFPVPNTDRKETFLQQDLPHRHSSLNALNQADGKNTNASLYQPPSPFGQSMSKPLGNVQYTNNTQLQRPNLAAKSDSNMTNSFVRPENDQNIGMKEKTIVTNNFTTETGKMESRNNEIPMNRMAVEGSCDETYPKGVQLNQTSTNYGLDQRDTYSQQDLRRMPPIPFDQVENKNTTTTSLSYQPPTTMESFTPDFQYISQSRSTAAKSGIPSYTTVGSAQIEGHEEKVVGAREEISSKNDGLPPNRMAVEGSCGNVEIPYTRPVPSSTPNQSVSYEHWYSNNSKNSFPDNSHAEDSRQTRDNVYGSEKLFIGTQGMQQPQLLQTSSNTIPFPNIAGTIGSNVPEVPTMHSKTPSSLSNASSTNNELSNYQLDDNFSTDSKRDHSSNADHLEGKKASITRDMRINSSVIDEKTASCSDLEDRSIEMRTVIGYNNNNTIPRRKNENLTGERKSNNLKNLHKGKEPPLEQRMVVGETSSDAPPSSQRMNQSANDHDGRSRRSKTDRFVARSEKHKIKQQYNDRKDRRKVESEEDYDDDDDDEDDDDDLDYEKYDDGRNRYRESPKMFRRGPRRKPVDSSKYRFNDYDSDDYFEDEDYDYYKSRLKYFSKGQMKEPSYQRNLYSRSYANRKPIDNHRYAYDDSFSVSSRNSRPTSRSQIKYPEVYELLNPYRLAYENKLDKRELRKCLDLWETDLRKYVLWFHSTFEKDYVIWYNGYYLPRVRNCSNNVYETDRRGSGHSDRNSVINDSLSVNEERLLVGVNDGSFFRPVESQTGVLRESRYTPMKYQGPHAKGVFNSFGQLILVKGNYPECDRSAKVEIYQLSPPDDADWREFLKYPGPFIVGDTRPNTVCDLLSKRMKESRTSSEKLLYLLIKLIIRGVSDGAVVSEILNESCEREYGADVILEDTESKQTTDGLSPKEILDKYTNLLLQGSQDSALDWAMEHELWGHAIFLASKIVTSRYREVLSKFKANISANNPLKTLYQLYLDEIPQVASTCRDEKWGDWRPHLAMILSNRAPDNEQHKAAIITLGDSLASKDIYAAHFCYVAAELVFDTSNYQSTKYSLLGLPNNVHQFDTNTPNDVILLTQMYEYAKRLQRKEFTIVALLPYKYLLATRLLNYGKVEVALQYLKTIAIDVMKESSDQYVELSRNVFKLSERIVFSDSSTDQSWLQDLKRFVNENNKSFHLLTHDEKSSFQSQPFVTVPSQQSILSSSIGVSSSQSVPLMFSTSNVSEQSNLLTIPSLRSNQQWQGNTVTPAPVILAPSFPQPTQLPIKNSNETPTEDSQDTAMQQSNTYGQEDCSSPWNPPQQPISISMHSSNNYFNESVKPSNGETKNLQNRNQPSKNQSSSMTTTSSNQQDAKNTIDEKKSQGNNNWLTGIVAKLKGTNVTVAKLPDDTDIRFQYDHDKQQWVDKDKKDDEQSAIRELPPPKATFGKYQPNDNGQEPGRNKDMSLGSQSTLLGSQNVPSGPQSIPSAPLSLPSLGNQNNLGPSMSNSNNMYTLPRGRGMKANYVNVLSNSTGSKFTNNVPSVSPTTMMNSFPGA